MSYWPELRDSLAAAAERQHAERVRDPPVRAHRGRGRLRAFLPLFLATATALAVALIALTVVRHKPPPTSSPTGHSAQVAKERAAREAARRLLSQVALLPGAVRSGLVPGVPADLWHPSEVLRTPHRVDIFKVWWLPERPAQVIKFIEAHLPPGAIFRYGYPSEAASVNVNAQDVFIRFSGNLPPAIWRELVVAVARMPGGGSVLRADGEAAWLYPRSTAEQFPVSVDRVQASLYVPGHRYVPMSTTSDGRIQTLIALLNTLLVRQGTPGCGAGDTGVRESFAFYSRGRVHPVATAVYSPSCDTIAVTIRGRSQPSLEFTFPTVDPLRDEQQRTEFLSFVRQWRKNSRPSPRG